MNISLPDSLKAWVEEQVAQGGFGTVSEYIRSLIRDAQKRQAREEVEKQLLAGVDSGPVRRMTRGDLDEIRREGRQRLRARKHSDGK